MQWGKKALKLAGLMAGVASATISLALSATRFMPVAVATGVLRLLGCTLFLVLNLP